jgi:hypothetical protein
MALPSMLIGNVEMIDMALIPLELLAGILVIALIAMCIGG